MSAAASPDAPLHGPSLRAFLDRAEAFWDDGDEFDGSWDRPHPSGIPVEDRRAAVIEQLREQRFAPATADEIRRLAALWMSLDQPREANAVIRAHWHLVPRTMADSPAPTHAWLDLCLEEAQSRQVFDPQGARECLPEIEVLIGHYTERATRDRSPSSRHCNTIRTAWFRLLDIALNTGACEEIVDAGYDALRAFEREYLDPDNAANPTYRDAEMCLNKARYAVKWNQPEALERHIRAAIAWMQQVWPVEYGWEHLCREVLEISPAHILAVIAASEAHLARMETPPPAEPVLATRRAENARWQAEALAAQERWEEALEWARRGHFALEGDHWQSDHFGESRLEWLLKARRMEEAAELAWQGIWHVRNGLEVSAYLLALEQREIDASRPHWDWILAVAQWREGLLKGGRLAQLKRPPPLPASAYLERASTIAPGHPMHDLIEGVRLAGQARWRVALPLLERGVLALPEYADDHSVSLLWCARFQQLGEEQALARPFPESHGAGWCYNIALNLEEDDDGMLHRTCADRLTAATHERRRALGVRYYETGRARFEAFFIGGEGAFMDADFDIYSQLCNNLAIQYLKDRRVDEAIALHHAGLACKPHAQHHENLVCCVFAKGDHPAVIAAAEQHFHAVREHDYQGHHACYNPADLAHKIASALHHEHRHHEISIWIDRLHTWWEHRNEDEIRLTCRGDYLGALVALLRFYAVEYASKAEPLLRAHLPEITALDETGAGTIRLARTLRRTAATLKNCGHTEEALGWYQRALDAAAPDQDAFDINSAHDAIARLRSQSRPHSHKWTFWT